MGFPEYPGFQPLTRNGTDHGARPGMVSCAQLGLIRVIWREHTNHRAEEAVNKWLLRSFKMSGQHFARKDAAQMAITALKAAKVRAT